MQHYQLHLTCANCRRVTVIDIVSIGSPHQFVRAATCIECVPALGGNLLAEGAVEDVAPPEQQKLDSVDMDAAFNRYQVSNNQSGAK